MLTGAYHPARRARAPSGHMVAHSSVLTRAPLLALLPVFTRRTQVFAAAGERRTDTLQKPHPEEELSEASSPSSISNKTVALGLFCCCVFLSRRYIPVYSQCPCVSRGALTFPGHMVTGGSVLALTFLEASVAIGSCFTRRLAAPASVPRGADAGSGDGVTQRVVLALAPLGAVGPPVAAVASWWTSGGKSFRFHVPRMSQRHICGIFLSLNSRLLDVSAVQPSQHIPDGLKARRFSSGLRRLNKKKQNHQIRRRAPRHHIASCTPGAKTKDLLLITDMETRCLHSRQPETSLFCGVASYGQTHLINL